MSPLNIIKMGDDHLGIPELLRKVGHTRPINPISFPYIFHTTRLTLWEDRMGRCMGMRVRIYWESLEFSSIYYHVPLWESPKGGNWDSLFWPLGILAHPKLKMVSWNLHPRRLTAGTWEFTYCIWKGKSSTKNHHFQVQAVNLRGCKHDLRFVSVIDCTP